MDEFQAISGAITFQQNKGFIVHSIHNEQFMFPGMTSSFKDEIKEYVITWMHQQKTKVVQ